jgi:hypothetical protein
MGGGPIYGRQQQGRIKQPEPIRPAKFDSMERKAEQIT